MSNISQFENNSELTIFSVEPGRLYTLGGVQPKQVDQYNPESDTWKDFFPSLRHCRVAHAVVAVADTIFVAGGSAKANANFGPGLTEMESCRVSQEDDIKPEWKIAGSKFFSLIRLDHLRSEGFRRC